MLGVTQLVSVLEDSISNVLWSSAVGAACSDSVHEPYDPMTSQGVRRAVRIGLASLVLSATSVGGQTLPNPSSPLLTLWGGVVFDGYDEKFPSAPQFMARGEGNVVGSLWIGGEGSFVLSSEGVNSLDGGASRTYVKIRTAVSGTARLALSSSDYRPYVLATAGVVVRSDDPSAILGVGTGLRIPVSASNDLRAEVRYRRDRRFSILTWDFWEISLGVGLW